ncbi:MAG: N-6 DNA methylase [Gemmatimonadales bacterium]|nr:N-6 DNA methylase [Gemmatimonadales bacterium]
MTKRERKATGSHYTPPQLAAFIANQAVEAWAGTHQPAILDPAAGDGALLDALICRLQSEDVAPSIIAGFDTDGTSVQRLHRNLSSLAHGARVDCRHGDFLESVLGSSSPSFDLFNSGATASTPRLFDIVIANPPYVRTQVLGTEVSRQLAGSFGLTGRVDLAFAFLVGIALVLKPGGIAGIIVSNRFMTTRAGTSVREAIRKHFDILHVWDLGDTRIFDAAVLPAVLLLRRKSGEASVTPGRFTSIYAEAGGGAATPVSGPLDALGIDGPVSTPEGTRYCVRQGRLCLTADVGAVWRLKSEATEEWLETVDRHTASRFGDIGKIRVGVKSTADKVFIRSDWHLMDEGDRPELLRPLTTHHAARRVHAVPTTYQILYPHSSDGETRTAVDLARFPRAERYLERHRVALTSRTYVVEAGRKWFEIWVPHDPALWAAPKLVFRDISERPTFWLDLDGTVVNGDCYWLVDQRRQLTDEMWLALAVGNSTFIEAFYDRRFNNKLYSGRRRFMTQYVEQFPIPSLVKPEAQAIVCEMKRGWKEGFDLEMESRVDALVWVSFGLSREEIAR